MTINSPFICFDDQSSCKMDASVWGYIMLPGNKGTCVWQQGMRCMTQTLGFVGFKVNYNDNITSRRESIDKVLKSSCSCQQFSC